MLLHIAATWGYAAAEKRKIDEYRVPYGVDQRGKERADTAGECSNAPAATSMSYRPHPPVSCDSKRTQAAPLLRNEEARI
jgi:hypothetical protein